MMTFELLTDAGTKEEAQMTNKATEDKAAADVAGQVDPLVRRAMRNAELDPLVTALCFLRKLYVAMEINDYGDIVIPHSVYDDCGKDVLMEIGKLELVIASNITTSPEKNV